VACTGSPNVCSGSPSFCSGSPSSYSSSPNFCSSLFCAGVGRLPSFCVSGLYRLTKHLHQLCSGSPSFCSGSPSFYSSSPNFCSGLFILCRCREATFFLCKWPVPAYQMSAPAHLVSAPAHQVSNPAHQISAPAYLFYAGVGRLPSFCVSGLYRLTKYLLWLCSGSLNICISSPISVPAHLVSTSA